MGRRTEREFAVAEPVGDPFRTRFLEERDALMVGRLRLALSMGLCIYVGFWALDYVQHPKRAIDFGLVRLSVAVMCLVVRAMAASPFGRRHILLLSTSILSLVGFSLTLMTVPLGGFESDYFIGNMLTLFCVGMFMPWPTRATVLFCAVLVLPYFGLNLIVHGPSLSMASPVAFLSGTGVLTIFATSAWHRLREQDLRTRMQLERANDDLKQLDEAKTRFFSNVSHELRTPLTLITGPLAELREQNLGYKANDMLDAIAMNADRLSRHVNMILDFARIEGGKLRPSLENAELSTVLTRLITAAAPYAAQHGVALHASGLDTLPPSRFDPEQIETVAANLLSNAVKFTPAPGEVQVTAGHGPANVWFEVRDNGPGIPEGDIDRVFDRFYQVERGAAGKSKGTGLGLALCRELVNLHGGSLRVESVHGSGTTFRVTLPKAPPERAERRTRGRRRADRIAQAHLDTLISDSYASRQGTQTLLADLKAPITQSSAYVAIAADDAPVLLIVEDDPELRAYLIRNLAADYQIEVASNGRSGLEAGKRRPPDIILSDIMMPEMDGIQMVEAMAEDPSLSRIPVVFLTARASDEDIVEGLTLGAVDYILKPFKMPELKARLIAHLRASRVERRLDERETRLAAVGEMTGQIAHDLRGPLTAIVGHTELARELAEESTGAHPLVDDLNAVERAALRAVDMIQEVVDFAREGSVPVHMEPSDLGQLIETIATDHRPALESLGIELVVDRPDTGGPITVVDRGRIRRVVENLINNSREAITEQYDPGSVGSGNRIGIGVRGADGGVELMVVDNGPGIPPEVAANLFNPFVTAGKEHGTGLGLAIVRNLVAAHGGSVTVEPAPAGGGAAFRVFIPTPDVS